MTQAEKQQQAEETKLAAALKTKQLLEADRKRAADILLQLHYQFSQQVTTMEIL